MKNIIYLLIIVIYTLSSLEAFARDENYTIKPKIIKVFDGDTVLIKTKEGTASVRLTGIDCFETSMNPHIKYQKAVGMTYEEIFVLGNKAKKELESLIYNKNIFLEITGVDRKYGRFVGILYDNDVNINKKMLNSGLCPEYKFNAKDN